MEPEVTSSCVFTESVFCRRSMLMRWLSQPQYQAFLPSFSLSLSSSSPSLTWRMPCWSAGWIKFINQEWISFSFILRLWREVGEQPKLWSTLELKFPVVWRLYLGDLPFQQNQPVRWIPGGIQEESRWTKDLLRVLNMRRLQTLRQMTLDFSGPWTSTSPEISLRIWKECEYLVKSITEKSSTVRKLCLESMQPDVAGFRPWTWSSFLVELVKFEQVDFGFHSTRVAVSILRLLSGLAPSPEMSKLRVLWMPDCESTIDPDYVTKARKFLTVRFRKPWVIIIDKVVSVIWAMHESKHLPSHMNSFQTKQSNTCDNWLYSVCIWFLQTVCLFWMEYDYISCIFLYFGIL